MVHVWGGAWNINAKPSIEKDYDIKEGYHYFQSENKKNKFLEIIDKPEYSNQGIVRDIKYGNLTHYRTIFVGTMRYKDKEFTIHHDFGYEYDPNDAYFDMIKTTNIVAAENLSVNYFFDEEDEDEKTLMDELKKCGVDYLMISRRGGKDIHYRV